MNMVVASIILSKRLFIFYVELIVVRHAPTSFRRDERPQVRSIPMWGLILQAANRLYRRFGAEEKNIRQR